MDELFHYDTLYDRFEKGEQNSKQTMGCTMFLAVQYEFMIPSLSGPYDIYSDLLYLQPTERQEKPSCI